jgi:hypothetical protein
VTEPSGRNETTSAQSAGHAAAQDQAPPATTAGCELPHSVPDDAELTEGQRAEAADVIESIVEIRRNKANRATRGVLAALLCLEALVVLLVPRAIAQTSTGLDGTKTGILIALAVVLVATGFVLKRPWGIGLGSVLQIAVVVTGVLTLVMLFIGLIFVAIWLWVLTMRRDLVGTPSGLKMLVS